jgi:pimeloyl-ACP methyl ester carboxylesterase
MTVVTRSRAIGVALLAATLVGIAAVGVLAFTRVEASRRERLTRNQVMSGRFVQAADVDLHVEIEGPPTAPVVLLLHGTGAWGEIWRETMHSVARAGYRAVAIDLPPFGYSKRPYNANYSDDAQARRILAAIDGLRLHRQQVTLVAHSFSARPALEATFIAPERIESLVLVDAALDLDPPQASRAARAAGAVLRSPLVREAAVAATLTNPRFTRRLLLKLISDSSAATPERVAMLQRPLSLAGTTEAYGAWLGPFLTKRERSRSTESARYRSLVMPTLVIWGARDAVTPLAQGRRLAELIPGAQLEVLPTAGHIPAIEAGKQFDAALVAFLQEAIPLHTVPVF